jgi:Na+/H+ antiporter NhaD/arsenite permease-like protein
MAVAVITFIVALAVIASERVNRTKVALLGAVIVVLFVGWRSRRSTSTRSACSRG